VDVLKLRLLSPAKQYVINFRGTLNDNGTGGSAENQLSSDQASAELADIAAHGFHYIALSDDPTNRPQEVAVESQFNFQTPIVYQIDSGAEGLKTAMAVDKTATAGTSYDYLVPDGPTMSEDIAALKKAGLQTAAVIGNESVYNQVQGNLDVAIYPVDNSYVQQLLRTDGQRKSITRDWLTWPAYQSDPQVDRLYSGYLLWKTDLYGGYISDYETYYNADPYDDALAPSDPKLSSDRPDMLTYPTQNGVIDTVQWESIREGINDVRYLTTFYTALRECKDAKVDLVEVAKAETEITSFLDRAFWLMSDVDYQKGRAMITKYAIELRQAVDGYNARINRTNRQSNVRSRKVRTLG
jgi:hypothetical protein